MTNRSAIAMILGILLAGVLLKAVAPGFAAWLVTPQWWIAVMVWGFQGFLVLVWVVDMVRRERAR